MKRLLWLLLLLASIGAAAQTTTVTGTIKDVAGNPVTSGYIQFTLQPPLGATIGGVAFFTPGAVQCDIVNGSIYASDGVSPCAVQMNTAMSGEQPNSSTYYQVQFCPYNACSSAITWYAYLATQDVSTIVVTPATAPGGQQSFSILEVATLYSTQIYTSASPVVNVKAQPFGATGNGTTDDTSAIQAAINSTSPTTGLVYFPAGSYKVSTALTCSSSLGGLIGDGVHQSKLVASGSNSILVCNNVQDGFQMRGLQFAGPGQFGASGQEGVKLAGSPNVSDAIFEDLYFYQWPNYAFELDAPIVTSLKNIRVLQSLKGTYINGGTSTHVDTYYANQVAKDGLRLSNSNYSTVTNVADDTGGIAIVLDGSSTIDVQNSGHEVGTAYNVNVTAVSVSGGVATITYSDPNGTNLANDFIANMHLVIQGTTLDSGALNGRWICTGATSTTLTFNTSAGNISGSDTGTASLAPGDGLITISSSQIDVDGYRQLAAQQVTSVMVGFENTCTNCKIERAYSTLGTSGTPQTQTYDLWFDSGVVDAWRGFNTLIGGVKNLGSAIQTYGAGLWTLSNIAHTGASPAQSGFIRALNTDHFCWRNYANGGDDCFAVNSSDQATYNGNIVSAGQNYDNVAGITFRSSPYTVQGTDSFIGCDASGGAVVIDLPATSGSGREITVKKSDGTANPCTLTAAGSDLIDGSSTYALISQRASIKVVDVTTGFWDGANVPQLAGDVTGASQATTVAKVNGNTPGGACTNQVVTSLDSSARPTCSTVTSLKVDSSICSNGSCTQAVSEANFQTCQVTAPTTSVSVIGCRTFLVNAHSIKRLYIFANTQAVGCTTSPIIDVWDYSAGAGLGINVTLGNGTTTADSGAISVATTAAHVLGFKVTTAAAGCSTSPQIAAVATYE